MSRDSIAKDLSQHFADRLRDLLEDTADTMTHADFEYREIAAMLISGLLGEAATGVRSLNGDKATFMAACRLVYDAVEETRRRTRKRAAKKTN